MATLFGAIISQQNALVRDTAKHESERRRNLKLNTAYCVCPSCGKKFEPVNCDGGWYVPNHADFFFPRPCDGAHQPIK